MELPDSLPENTDEQYAAVELKRMLGEMLSGAGRYRVLSAGRLVPLLGSRLVNNSRRVSGRSRGFSSSRYG